MSLCVAATCSDRYAPAGGADDGYRVVIGFDMLRNDGVVAADIAHKFLGATKKWCCLIAGDLAEAKEIGNYLAAVLNEVEDMLNPGFCIQMLRKALDIHRLEFLDRYLMRELGMDLDTFHATGRRTYGQAKFNEICTWIANLQPDVEMIIIGWTGSWFQIFQYNKGDLFEQDAFAAVGSGAQMANFVFHYRDHVWYRDLPTTLYTAYEAMRFGAISPTVSRWDELKLTVLRYTDSGMVVWDNITPEGGGFLHTLFRKFGPQDIDELEGRRLWEGFWADSIEMTFPDNDPHGRMMRREFLESEDSTKRAETQHRSEPRQK